MKIASSAVIGVATRTLPLTPFSSNSERIVLVKAGSRNCRFQPGAAESLAFPDTSFDVVVSSLMMHHLPNELRLKAAREMRRVLRPGGTLLLSDFTIPKRGGWRLVASITGHAGDRWRHRATPLEPLIAESDFAELRSGDAPPWLHYVKATKP
jgi:ubiquinone/menaquinone biosynthesis C-methylase UbiE